MNSELGMTSPLCMNAVASAAWPRAKLALYSSNLSEVGPCNHALRAGAISTRFPVKLASGQAAPAHGHSRVHVLQYSAVSCPGPDPSNWEQKKGASLCLAACILFLAMAQPVSLAQAAVDFYAQDTNSVDVEAMDTSGRGCKNIAGRTYCR